MLIISQKQLDALAQHNRDDRLISSIRKHLQTNYPQCLNTLTSSVIVKRIRFGLEKANRYGLTSHRDRSLFVTLMFAIAPNFDAQPLINDCLTDPELRGVDRLNLMMMTCTEDDWNEARENYDANAWERSEAHGDL